MAQEIICTGEVEKESQIVKGTISDNLKDMRELTHCSQEPDDRYHQNGLVKRRVVMNNDTHLARMC